MKRILSALVVGALCAAAPSLALAEDTGKTKKEEVKPDGTKVKTEHSKNWKDDGTGEAKTETTVDNPNTGTVVKKTSKVKKSKNMDGTTQTKTSTETEVKQ